MAPWIFATPANHHHNGSNTPFNGYQGYTVRIIGFDSATEIAEGDLRPDGNDLRVFYWDGATWTDVPRIVTGLNTSDTHIVFKSQVNISANGSDVNHYIIYGNPSAGTPDALTHTNVYLWYDDFSVNPFSGSPQYTLAKAVDIHGAGYSTPTYDVVNQRVNFDTGDNITSDMYVAPAQSRGWWDNLIIRRYTEPEPALSFGAEESLFANMSIGKTVNPSGTQPPGTDLTYTMTITSTGNSPAVSVVVTDTLAPEVEFKVGSVVNTLPPGVGVTVEYWNGATWAYVPVSTGCSAPAGYDGCVQYIRWTLLTDLGAVPPDHTGTLEFVSRIR